MAICPRKIQTDGWRKNENSLKAESAINAKKVRLSICLLFNRRKIPLLAFIGKTGCMSDFGLQTTSTLSQQKTSIWQKEDLLSLSRLTGNGLLRSFQWQHIGESRDESWSYGNAHRRQGSQLHRWPLSPNVVHFNRFYLFFKPYEKYLILSQPLTRQMRRVFTSSWNKERIWAPPARRSCR